MGTAGIACISGLVVHIHFKRDFADLHNLASPAPGVRVVAKARQPAICACGTGFAGVASHDWASAFEVLPNLPGCLAG